VISTTTRFWLIRHGEPAEQTQRLCYGSFDAGLSETGRAQMRKVAENLQNESIAAIYASPHFRALESARIIAARLARPVIVVEDLREIEFGEFEGLTYDEIAARYPETYRQWMETPTEVQFPNGEHFSDMRVRVLRAFDKVRRERDGQTSAIVSHGGVNRVLISWALEIPHTCLFRLAQDYAASNLLAFVQGIPNLQLLNEKPR